MRNQEIEEAIDAKIALLKRAKQAFMDDVLSLEDLKLLYNSVREYGKIRACYMGVTRHFYTVQGTLVKLIEPVCGNFQGTSDGEWEVSNAVIGQVALEDRKQNTVGVGAFVAKIGEYFEVFLPIYKRICYLDPYLSIVRDDKNKSSQSLVDFEGTIHPIVINDVLQEGFALNKVPYKKDHYLNVIYYEKEPIYCYCHGIPIISKQTLKRRKKYFGFKTEEVADVLEQFNPTFMEGNFQKKKTL